jgi:hypothetical protein
LYIKKIKKIKTYFMKKIQILLVASIGFSTTSLMAQTKASLKLPASKTYQVVNTLETTSSTDVQGQTMESTANITSTYKIEVKGKTGDNYNLSSTLSNISMNMTLMGQDIKFDSENPDDMNGEFGAALKDYIDQPKNLQMDNSGKIASDSKDTSVSGIVKRLQIAQNGYGTKLAFVDLPAHAKVGDSWMETNSGEGMSKTTNYTIKNITGNIATISFTTADSVSTTMDQSGMQIATKTTGTSEGEEKVDIKTGVIQSATSKGDASGNVSAMGQDFPMSVKINSSTTVKEL